MYTLIAKFPQQQVCRDRQYSGLLRWAAYIGALPEPTSKPADQWVKERILAGKIPQNTEFHISASIHYSAQDPTIQQSIREHMAPFNDQAKEDTLDAQIDGAMAVYMPKYAATASTQSEVDQWNKDHGFEAPSSP